MSTTSTVLPSRSRRAAAGTLARGGARDAGGALRPSVRRRSDGCELDISWCRRSTGCPTRRPRHGPPPSAAGRRRDSRGGARSCRDRRPHSTRGRSAPRSRRARGRAPCAPRARRPSSSRRHGRTSSADRPDRRCVHSSSRSRPGRRCCRPLGACRPGRSASEPTAPIVASLSAVVTRWSSQPEVTTVSLLRKQMERPRAIAAPRLQPWMKPRLTPLRMRSSPASRAMSSAVPSLEPSSITTICTSSVSNHVWAIDCRQRTVVPEMIVDRNHDRHVRIGPQRAFAHASLPRVDQGALRLVERLGGRGRDRRGGRRDHARSRGDARRPSRVTVAWRASSECVLEREPQHPQRMEAAVGDEAIVGAKRVTPRTFAC